MIEQLRNMVQDWVIKAGENGVERLAVGSGVSPSTIRDVIKTGHLPRARTIYRLALACGRDEEEARALAKQRLSAARESA